MSLLAMTLCLTDGQRADCERQSRYVETIQQCREIGTAMGEYLKDNATAPGLSVSFTASCGTGTDG